VPKFTRKPKTVDPFDTTPTRRWHRLRAYRYRVADPGYRALWNGSDGVIIGVCVVVGHYAYCLKWADSIPKPMVGSAARDSA
jgi:hypothetical protein